MSEVSQKERNSYNYPWENNLSYLGLKNKQQSYYKGPKAAYLRIDRHNWVGDVKWRGFWGLEQEGVVD